MSSEQTEHGYRLTVPTRLLMELEEAITFLPDDISEIGEKVAWVRGSLRRAGFPMDVTDAIYAKLTLAELAEGGKE